MARSPGPPPGGISPGWASNAILIAEKSRVGLRYFKKKKVFGCTPARSLAQKKRGPGGEMNEKGLKWKRKETRGERQIGGKDEISHNKKEILYSAIIPIWGGTRFTGGKRGSSIIFVTRRQNRSEGREGFPKCSFFAVITYPGG